MHSLSMLGVLNVHKPGGMTSRRVVDQVARLVRPAKAGHAGTLDPLASGVLVVCVGACTRLIEFVQKSRKRYLATFLLGHESDTEDVEGTVTLLPDAHQPTLAELQVAAGNLLGEILQRPPDYSALKVQGRRAYDLARAGETVRLEPRPVTIHGLEIVSYGFPELVLDVQCGTGTYIRSLGRDLALSVGTGAVMSALVRTQVGDFLLEDACALSDLSAETLPKCLLPPEKALTQFPRLDLSAEQARRVLLGQKLLLPDLAVCGKFAAFDDQGCLLGVAERLPDGTLRAVVNLSRAN